MENRENVLCNFYELQHFSCLDIVVYGQLVCVSMMILALGLSSYKFKTKCNIDFNVSFFDIWFWFEMLFWIWISSFSMNRDEQIVNPIYSCMCHLLLFHVILELCHCSSACVWPIKFFLPCWTYLAFPFEIL